MAAPDAFIAGKLVDEEGLSPLTACYTIVTAGTLHGRSGFVKIRGDHQLAEDGTFLSPALFPGKYFLRFFGMLIPPSRDSKSESSSAKQSRVFDFFYPSAGAISGASPVELHPGESVNMVIRVPKPTWFNVSGRVLGKLPAERAHMAVMFEKNTGILEGIGGVGFPLDAIGRFTGMLLGGSYSASLHEMTPPESTGYTRSIRQFGSTVVSIEADVQDLNLALRN